ncbi:MAG: DUF4235 domain-containing protein [Actinomycetota bacterium]|nr:DUF4235 domain-containing protein [Actinomycetota bacterium]
MEGKELLWKAVGATAGVAAAVLTRKTLVGAWQRRRGSDPPANPASPTTGWGEALTWAAVTGLAIGVARIVAARGAAAGWQRAMGELPPGLEEVA